MRRLALLVVIAGCGTAPRATSQTEPPSLAPADPSATGLWEAVIGHWPRLDHETVEALAIAPSSVWGNIAVGWSAGANDRYVVRSRLRGPYQTRAPLALDGAAAHVVKVTMTSADPAIDQPVIATDLQVLPVDAAAILDDAAARWAAHLAEQQGAIDGALAEAGRLSAGRALGPEATAITDGFGPTWFPESHRMQVIYVRKVTRSSTMMERIGGGGCNKYKNMHGNVPGFPDERGEVVACAPPRYEIRHHTRAYSIDVGLVLRYRADGTLSAVLPYAPHPVPSAGPF
jgi:hypothetical protein